MSPCWRATERALAAAFLAAGLASCVTQSGVVVLLPEKDGREAALTIQQGEDKVVLDRPYGAANLTSWGPRKYELGAEDVQSRFGEALAAQPARAKRVSPPDGMLADARTRSPTHGAQSQSEPTATLANDPRPAL